MNRSTEHWFEYYTSASKEDIHVFEKVQQFSSFFKDMLFEGSENELEELAVPEELAYMDYTWFTYRVMELENSGGYYDHKNQVLAVANTIDEKDYNPIILHEMIHLHEDIINEFPLFYHDVLFWNLYSKLKKKIENIDSIIKDNTFLYESLDRYNTGGLHDLLFLLKSFDLDLRMGYELGTVYGYGKREEMQEVLDKYTNCRDELLAVVTDLVKRKGVNEFTVEEATEAMKDHNSIYAESTIRTHITSKCCVNAPKHHITTYNDYERIDKGIYRINNYQY